jgi:hypothetical protein
VPAQVSLTQADVQQIIAQAVAEAQAQGTPASIAVVDRVGNVLAFYVMNGANLRLKVPDVPGPGVRPSGSGPSRPRGGGRRDCQGDHRRLSLL